MDSAVLFNSKFIVAGFLAGCLSAPAYGQATETNLEFSGEFNFGTRIYSDDGLFQGQSDSGVKIFAGAIVNAGLSFGNLDFVGRASATFDDENGRTSLRVEKAYLTTDFDDLNVLVGYNVVNWGSAVSSSPTNFMNPVDFSDRSTNPNLIGTPMINGNYHSDFGTFSAYLLPGFVQPEFGDAGSRFRPFWETSADFARFEKSNENDLDFALRYTNNFSVGSGNFDVAASYFKGTNRNPISLPGCIRPGGAITDAICQNANDVVQAAYESSAGFGVDPKAFWAFLEANLTDAGATALSTIPAVGFFPYYNEIERIGVDVNYSTDDLQLRFEGTYNKTSRDNYVEAVVGGDYTFNNVAGSDGTLTVAVEYLYSGLAKTNPFVVFGDDIFVGLDYRTNNARDTRFNTGVFYDLNSDAVLATAKASTRLNDALSLEVSFQKAFVTGYNDPLAFTKRDGFVELKLRSFF